MMGAKSSMFGLVIQSILRANYFTFIILPPKHLQANAFEKADKANPIIIIVISNKLNPATFLTTHNSSQKQNMQVESVEISKNIKLNS